MLVLFWSLFTIVINGKNRFVIQKWQKSLNNNMFDRKKEKQNLFSLIALMHYPCTCKA